MGAIADLRKKISDNKKAKINAGFNDISIYKDTPSMNGLRNEAINNMSLNKENNVSYSSPIGPVKPVSDRIDNSISQYTSGFNNGSAYQDISAKPVSGVGIISNEKPVIGSSIMKKPVYVEPTPIKNGTVNNMSVPNFKDFVTPYATSSVPLRSTSTAPTAGTYDPSSDLNALRQAQIDRTVSNLKSRYEGVVSGINKQRGVIPEQYQTKKSGASVDSQMQAKNFSEFLANRGLTRSGTAVQAEMNRGNQLQQTYNQYDAQQKLDYDTLKQKEDDALNTYNYDVTGAENLAETNYLQALSAAKSKQSELDRAEKMKYLEMDNTKDYQNRSLEQDLYKTQVGAYSDAVKAYNQIYGFNLDADTSRYATDKKSASDLYNIDTDAYTSKYNTDAQTDYQNKSLEKGYYDTDAETARNIYNTDQTTLRNMEEAKIKSADSKYDTDAKTAIENAKNLMEQAKIKASALKELGYANPYEGEPIPDKVREMLAPYSSNYAEVAQYFAKTNPELSRYASMLSAEKMFKNPALLKQYGEGAGFKTSNALKTNADILKTNTDIREAEVSIIGKNIDNLRKSVEYQYLEPKLSRELDVLDMTLQEKGADVFRKQLENSNLPEKMKLDLAQGYQQIASSKSADERGWANVAIAQENLQLSKNRDARETLKANGESDKSPLTIEQARSEVSKFGDSLLYELKPYTDQNGKTTYVKSPTNLKPDSPEYIAKTADYIDSISNEKDADILKTALLGQGARSSKDILSLQKFYLYKNELDNNPLKARSVLMNNRDFYIGKLGKYYFDTLLDGYK